MKIHNFWTELENIQFKYERLTSLISIMQAVVDEVAEIRNISAGSLNDALFEIWQEMDETNERLKGLISQRETIHLKEGD